MASLERKLGGFWNNMGVGIAAIASAFCLSASDLQAQSAPEKEAAIKQLYPRAEVNGEETLSGEQFNKFMEQSKQLPDKLLPSITKISFTNNYPRAGDSKITGTKEGVKYEFLLVNGEIPHGILFHEVGGHLYTEYSKLNGSRRVLADFMKIRGAVKPVSDADVLNSSSAASFYRWPDGLLGPTNGCFTVYGTTSPIEDLAESMRVLNTHKDNLRDFLNPSGKMYDKRFVDKLEFLKEKGFIKSETYQEIKTKAGIQ
jgi:hypothetical protein